MSTFTTFKELNLPEPLHAALEKMNFQVPTAVQSASLPPALAGKDILGSAQTGTGKTAAFGIPLLAKLYPNPGTKALILAPTRELAAQIHKVLAQMCAGTKMKGALLVGGESFYRQKSDVKGGADYYVCTPGRLIDHLDAGLKLPKITTLVLDEVDRMLDMGFAPQLQQIVPHLPPVRQTLLFSATLPKEILAIAATSLKDPVRVSIGPSSSPIAKVKQESHTTTHLKKNDLLLQHLKAAQGRVLIFARTQIRTDRVFSLLKEMATKSSAFMADVPRAKGKRPWLLSVRAAIRSWSPLISQAEESTWMISDSLSTTMCHKAEKTTFTVLVVPLEMEKRVPRSIISLRTITAAETSSPSLARAPQEQRPSTAKISRAAQKGDGIAAEDEIGRSTKDVPPRKLTAGDQAARSENPRAPRWGSWEDRKGISLRDGRKAARSAALEIQTVRFRENIVPFLPVGRSPGNLMAGQAEIANRSEIVAPSESRDPLETASLSAQSVLLGARDPSVKSPRFEPPETGAPCTRLPGPRESRSTFDGRPEKLPFISEIGLGTAPARRKTNKHFTHLTLRVRKVISLSASFEAGSRDGGESGAQVVVDYGIAVVRNR